jgi:hypothetical protein
MAVPRLTNTSTSPDAYDDSNCSNSTAEDDNDMMNRSLRSTPLTPRKSPLRQQPQLSTSNHSQNNNSISNIQMRYYQQQQQHSNTIRVCTIRQLIITGMLLCFAFLSFSSNWSDLMLHQTQYNSMFTLNSDPSQQEEQQQHEQSASWIMLRQPRKQALTFIPSIDEVMINEHLPTILDTTPSRQISTITTSSVISQESDNDVPDISQESNNDVPVDNRPPLDTIIDDNDQIIGDPEWLLDFAILGYGKCGTSTMMFWLKEHPEIQAFGREKGHFMARKPGLMIRQLYENLEPGPYQRGYKAPQDVTQTHILDYYRAYWPNAKFILGIRHPIRWFESLYNFRIQNLKIPTDLPNPNDLIGPCKTGRYLTCTNKGDFANSLLKLGQQNYPSRRPATELEKSIVERYNRTIVIDTSKIEYMSNPIFIFELDQLSDSNSTRNDQFRMDFTNFMQLKEPLPPLPHYIPGKKRTSDEQIIRDKLKINICHDEYIPVRNELMVLARSSSEWIRTVFLLSPTVTVSSKEYFESILMGWMKDPCDDYHVSTLETTTSPTPATTEADDQVTKDE